MHRRNPVSRPAKVNLQQLSLLRLHLYFPYLIYYSNIASQGIDITWAAFDIVEPLTTDGHRANDQIGTTLDKVVTQQYLVSWVVGKSCALVDLYHEATWIQPLRSYHYLHDLTQKFFL